LGEDAGLQTVTGLILGANKWVGDVINVKIRSVDRSAPLNPTHNWEGVYSVTLKAIDPFYDSLNIDLVANYVAYIRVNHTVSPPELYLDPAATVPSFVMGYRDANGVPRTHSRNAMGANIFSPIPDGVDIYALPTLAEAYTAHAMGQKRITASFKRRRQRRRGEFVKPVLAQRARPRPYTAIKPKAHPPPQPAAKQHHRAPKRRRHRE
jgi:hypothetical protein